MTPDARLEDLGIDLPDLLPIGGNYRLARRHGDTVYVAGHVSAKLDRSGLIAGKVGSDVSLEQAREAARACALYMLATLRAELGSLEPVTAILKVFGMVNAAPGFVDEAKVLDGCTDQLVAVFGPEVGTPARVAIGVAELPLGAAVETDMIVAAAS
jgi:enamine deaminase RidA (YjgF/YER057c/UK114 family)